MFRLARYVLDHAIAYCRVPEIPVFVPKEEMVRIGFSWGRPEVLLQPATQIPSERIGRPDNVNRSTSGRPLQQPKTSSTKVEGFGVQRSGLKNAKLSPVMKFCLCSGNSGFTPKGSSSISQIFITTEYGFKHL